MESAGSPAARPRWSWWLLVGAMLVVPVGVTIGAYLLLTSQAVSFEVLRTAATVGVGTGGLITLGAILHRQRLAAAEHERQLADQSKRFEIAEHNRLDAERRFEQAERVAAAGQRDAAERRAQELFVKAVEQLGHDKAAVRVGALHALDALGQEHEHRRRAVIDVWCAYLRMPPSGTSPAQKTDDDGEAAGETVDTATPMPGCEHESVAVVWPADELQVRATAERLIAEHLGDERTDADRDAGKPASEAFWGPRDIDLTGAHLHKPYFGKCCFLTATFTNARFAERASFRSARFENHAKFAKASFAREANFSGAVFAKYAMFEGARFVEEAQFESVRFAWDAWFARAAFVGGAKFAGATFATGAKLGAEFVGPAGFQRVAFAGPAVFGNARFAGPVTFEAARFAELVTFEGARFAGPVRFTDPTVTRTGFMAAMFEQPGQVEPESRVFLAFAHALPEGWRAAAPDGKPGRLLEWDPDFLASPPARQDW